MLAPGPEVGVVSDPVWVPVLLSSGARIGAFVWGTLWGSFANVVIHRVPLGESVWRPRSRCGACRTPIAAWHNIPVLSFLLLRGRCRACGEPFSLRYLTVELLCGVLSFALYMQHVHLPLVIGHGAAVLTWLLSFAFGVALIAITYIDLDHWIIPDVIVLPMAALALLVAALAPSVLGVDVWRALLAAAVGFSLFAGLRWLYLRTRGIEALGLGDAKLLLMVGAVLGPSGLVFTIGAGAIQGLLVSVPLLLSGRKVASQTLQEAHGDDPTLAEPDESAGVSGRRVPFGPFLALSALEYLLLGPQIDALLLRIVAP